MVHFRHANMNTRAPGPGHITRTAVIGRYGLDIRANDVSGTRPPAFVPSGDPHRKRLEPREPDGEGSPEIGIPYREQPEPREQRDSDGGGAGDLLERRFPVVGHVA